MNPAPTRLSWMVRPVTGWVKSIQPTACWFSIFTFGGGFGHQVLHSSKVCQGGGFSWFDSSPVRILEDVKYGNILPLRNLHIDPMYRHPGPLDILVCGPHQSGVNPTIDVSAHLRVGLLQLGYEAAVYPFQGIPHLHYQYCINGGNKEQKM